MKPAITVTWRKLKLFWISVTPFSWLLFACGGCAGCGVIQVWRWERAAAPFKELGGDAWDSADGASRLTGPSGLYGVVLTGQHICDDTLERLRAQMEQLPNLNSLILIDTAVTDAGLKHLKNLKQLRNLDLSGTRVSAEGLRELEGLELPKHGIHWGHSVIVPAHISNDELEELRKDVPEIHFVQPE